MYRSVLQQYSGSDSCLEAIVFSLCTNIHIYKALIASTKLSFLSRVWRLQKIWKFCSYQLFVFLKGQGTVIGSISIQRTIFVKEQRILSPGKKTAGPRIFSTASLKFSDTWENFGRGKKNSLHQKWLSVNRFCCKTNKILCNMRTGPHVILAR